MSDNDQNNPTFDAPEDAEGLNEQTGEIEDDATRQITGDALEEIRESASHDMAPEWLEKMRARKKEREGEEAEGDGADWSEPDAVQTEEEQAEYEPSGDPDTTEIERDATKAINRGELDTLMKEKAAEEAAAPDTPDDDATPGAGIVSKASKQSQDRPTREVEEEAQEAVQETSDDQSSGFSLPKPGSSSPSTDNRPTTEIEDAESEGKPEDDSLGDFSDEDLHAVVFGEGDDETSKDSETEEPSPDGDAPPQEDADPVESPGGLSITEEELEEPSELTDRDADTSGDELESGELDTSSDDQGELSAEEEPELSADVESELSAEEAPELSAEEEPEEPSVGDDESAPIDLEEAIDEELTDEEFADEETSIEPELSAESVDEEPKPPSGAEVEEQAASPADEQPPEDFPDYESGLKRPMLASLLLFATTLIWIVGGVLPMATSLDSPWETLTPAASMAGGIVSLILLFTSPSKWIEAILIAAMGIGIGSFALLTWTDVGTIDVSNYLGMAPIVGSGLAILGAVVTLIRSKDTVEEY